MATLKRGILRLDIVDTYVLGTTGDTTTDSDQILNVADTTNLIEGLFISGTGIPSGTTIFSIQGNTLTISQNATETNSGSILDFICPQNKRLIYDSSFMDINGYWSVDDIQKGWLVYTQAVDVGSAVVLNGIYHRYRISDIISKVDGIKLVAFMEWDEYGNEVDMPGTGITCAISEPSIENKLGSLVSVEVYSDLQTGSSEGQYSADVAKIIDELGTGVRLLDQVVSFDVSPGNVVYYNKDNYQWEKSNLSTNKPTGIFVDRHDNRVSIFGKTNIAGLSEGGTYYAQDDGTVSTEISSIKVGYAKSSNILLMDIDETGQAGEVIKLYHQVIDPAVTFGSAVYYNSDMGHWKTANITDHKPSGIFIGGYEEVALFGKVVLSGMIAGAEYFVQSDGSLDTTHTIVKAGTAKTANDFLLDIDFSAVSTLDLYFSQMDWVNNKLEIIKAGTPASGQIGPHNLVSNTTYNINIFKNLGGDDFKPIELSVKVNRSTGLVTLHKAALATNFDGYANIVIP